MMKKLKSGATENSEQVISEQTKEKAEIAKRFIEKKYQKNFEEEKKKKEYYDNLIAQMQLMNLDEHDKSMIKNEIIKYEFEYLRMRRAKESILDYEPLVIIGRGAFGEVRLCRHVKAREYFAVKKMEKTEMYKKNQLNHIRAERDVLANADSDWVVQLKSSFTDAKNLYLVMEFLAGGDLMNLLIEKDVFTEAESAFYMAECILAVEAVHKLKYIHRDLKPDNILIGKDGHIKLTDFGLCKLYDTRPSDILLDEIAMRSQQVDLDDEKKHKRVEQRDRKVS